MPDQATALRRLADAGHRARAEYLARKTIVIAGAQPRVGTTTLAASLAFAMTRQGLRTILAEPSSVLRGRAASRERVGLIDASRSRAPLAELWGAADEVWLVTTADVVAAMDAYAAIKACAALDNRPVVRLIVNQAFAASSPERVCASIAQSCERFLALEVTLLGTVPLDPCVIASSEAVAPLVERYPQSPAAQAIERMAALMATALR